MSDRSHREADDRSPGPGINLFTKIGLVTYGLVIISHFTWLPTQWQVQFDDHYAELILLSVVVLLLARRTFLTTDRGHGIFWGVLLFGFAAWLCNSVISRVMVGSSSTNLQLGTDILFLLHTAAVAVAIEIRIDTYNDRLWLQNRSLYAIGSFLLVFAVFGYFQIMPLIFVGPSQYTSPFALYAFIDAYLAIRFLAASIQASNDSWRRIYSYFGSALLLIFLADLLSLAYRFERIEYVPGQWLNLAWYLWYPVAIFATGLVAVKKEKKPSEIDHHFLTPATSGLLIFGLALPFVHVVGYGFSLFEPAARTSRDIFVAAWVVIITTILYGIYLLVRGRVAKLDSDRANAVQKAHDFESQLDRELRLRSLGRLSAGLAHDFGNTVTAISMHARAIENRLKHGKSPDQGFKGINQAIEYAQNLVSKLSLYGGTRRATIVETFDIHEEIDKTIQVIKPSIIDGVSLNYRPAPLPIMVTAERSMIHQVLTNYLYNAIDAIGQHGQVEISTEISEANVRCTSCREEISAPYVAMTVTDDGPGVDKLVTQNVFEPLVTTKPVGKGSGLGLSTVHGVMHAIGGHVGLRTGNGEGTRFIAYFPLSPFGDGAEPRIR